MGLERKEGGRGKVRGLEKGGRRGSGRGGFPLSSFPIPS